MVTKEKWKKLFGRIGQKGAATVEAVISFSVFLFVVFTILGVVNYCRAEALISNAVDAAAKELSQYSYFYEMSGLGKLSETIGKNAQLGANNINDVIGTVDTFYSSILNAGTQAGEDLTGSYNAIADGNYDNVVANAQHLLANTGNNARDVIANGEAIYDAFGGVGENPLIYMRSIIAVAGDSALNLFKSRAIAAPLGKLLIQKHFKTDGQSADEALQKLGVVDGLSGMNFRLSTIFHWKKPNEIHLVLYYKLKLFQLFDWAELELPLCKEAYCGAWLGGDDVAVHIARENQEEPIDVEMPPEETGDPAPTEAPTNPPVDTTGSYWYLPEQDEYNYDQKMAAFIQLLKDQYHCSDEYPSDIVRGWDENGNAYGFSYCIDADETRADLISWKAYCQSMEFIANLQQEYEESGGEKGIAPGTIEQYTMVVYVPENISDEDLAALMAKARQDAEIYQQLAAEQYGLDIPTGITFVKGGGNYDYEGGGGN